MAVTSPERSTASVGRYGGIILNLLFAAAALAPLLYLVGALAANYYDVPYYDTWSLYHLVAKFMNGDLSWGEYLFSQQVDSRPTVTRLLLLLGYSVSRNLAINVALNLSCAVATAGATLLLLRKCNPSISWPALLTVGAFFNLNFFSLAQWQNWNWHNQLSMYLPNIFFVLGWLVNTSSLRSLPRTLLVGLCCALSSFSFSGGLFQWFLIVPLTFGLSRKEKIRLWSVHFGAALTCFAFYFSGFQSRTAGLASGLADPGRVLTYIFAWLGSSLSGGNLVVAAIWGAILLLTFLVLGFQCFKSWREADGLQAGWLPWLSMGCYALISAGVASLGRSHIGLEQALRPRYCTISQWLILGIIGLSVTLLWQNCERKPAQTRLGAYLLALFAAGFILFQTRQDVHAAHQWNKFAERMHFEKQAFGLESAHPGQLWTFDHPNRHLVLNTYKMMQRAGFLRDSLHSQKVLGLLAARKTGRWNEGELHFATCLPFRDVRCSGWSIGGNAEAGNRVLVVLIASRSGKVLAVGDGPINRNRPDVFKFKKPASAALAGFDLQFQIPKMEPGIHRLAAFRYGKDEQSYYPIGASHEFEVPE